MDIGPSPVLPATGAAEAHLGRAGEGEPRKPTVWGSRGGACPCRSWSVISGSGEACSELRLPPRRDETGLQRGIRSQRQAAGGMAGPGCHRARVPYPSRWWWIPKEVGTWFPARCLGPRAWGRCWMRENSLSGSPVGTFRGEWWTPAPSRHSQVYICVFLLGLWKLGFKYIWGNLRRHLIPGLGSSWAAAS